jgi:hypothetical protein
MATATPFAAPPPAAAAHAIILHGRRASTAGTWGFEAKREDFEFRADGGVRGRVFREQEQEGGAANANTYSGFFFFDHRFISLVPKAYGRNNTI